MTELLTAAQMRAIEQGAINSGEVTGLELMERAGRGVVEAVFEEWPDLAAAPRRAVVLCGPGNNGGDGFVVARLLKDWGWDVEVFLYGDPAKLPPDAKANYERWMKVGGLETWDAEAMGENVMRSNVDLVVDALFGTGLARSLSQELRPLWKGYMVSVWSDDDIRFVAVDVPSGVCSDSGRGLGQQSLAANLTVTFHKPKNAHCLGDGPLACGRVIVKDIGLGKRWSRAPPRLVTEPSQWLSRSYHLGHKYTHGHALILSGGPGRTGAARLAARGALRIGAGLVTLGVPPSAQIEVASQITAIMLKRVPDADALTRLLTDTRLSALCLGPGLGTDDHARALIRATLDAERPTVLDADALSILFFDEADALFGKLHGQCVLTPHAGEFSRMFPDIAKKLNAPPTKGPAYSKVDATREAAARAGCVVLFKGPDTVIAGPDGRASINSAHYDRAAPWLATAGSGDVLAGFITGLMARGFRPMRAAETAAWLHVECALSFGPGLIAEDIPEELPKVFRTLAL